MPVRPEPSCHDGASGLEDAFREHYPDAVRYAANLLGARHHLAEDVVQTAFLELLKRVREGRAEFVEDAWKAAIKRNCWWAAHKVHRRERLDVTMPDPPAPAGPAATPDPWSSVDLRLELQRALAALPSPLRTALVHRYVADQPDMDSARRLGITVKAFRCRCARALPAAARLLGDVAAAAVALSLGVRAWVARRTPPPMGLEVGLLAPAMVCAIVGTQAGSATTARAVTGHAQAAAPQLSAIARALPAPGAAGSREHAAPAAPTTSSPPRLSGGRAGETLDPTAAARDETIDDTSVASAASPSDTAAGGDPDTVVAFGWGRTCGCAVVFQSGDGGRTWRAAPGPADPTSWVQQVELPPAYPADPRIFLTATWGRQAAVWVAPRFGRPFQPMLGPAGSLVMAAGYDAGNTVAFVGDSHQLSSVDEHSGAVTPVVFDPAPLAVYSLATAAPGSGALADVVASYATSPLADPVVALYHCTARLCTAAQTLDGHGNAGAAAVGNAELSFVADGATSSGGMALSKACAVMLSSDGGRTLSDPGTPVAGSCIVAAAMGALPGGHRGLWVTTHWNASDSAIAAYDPATGRWQTVLEYSTADGNPPVRVIPVGDRLLLAYTLGGLAVSGDGGAHWDAGRSV